MGHNSILIMNVILGDILRSEKMDPRVMFSEFRCMCFLLLITISIQKCIIYIFNHIIGTAWYVA